MAKPQQPELHRSGLTPADPGSVKVRRQVDDKIGPTTGPTGPIPEDNMPGHHPDVEQDKPVEAFVEKAKELAASAAPPPEASPAPPEPPSSGRNGPASDAPAPRSGGLLGSIPLEAVVPGLAALDAARRPGEAWAEVGESRSHWLRRIVLLPGLGSWQYAKNVKPRLDGAQVALRLRGG